MKTALLFPGLDSLFLGAKLRRWLDTPEVAKALKQASIHLSTLTGDPEDLEKLLREESRPHVTDFDRTLVALMALQVGIARTLQETETWDLLLGCSHGDIARSVMAGSLPFEGAVEVVWFFSVLRKSCPDGCTANVRTTDGSALNETQLAWLEEKGFPVSQWSSENATIAGERTAVQESVIPGRAMGIKIKPVLPYPVHSPVMKASADVLRAESGRWPLRAPNKPVFSSVWCRFISTSDEIREEALMGSISAIRWMPSISELVAKHGVTRFLNVGPSNTLTGWIMESDLMKHVELVDAWDHLNPAMASTGDGSNDESA